MCQLDLLLTEIILSAHLRSEACTSDIKWFQVAYLNRSISTSRTLHRFTRGLSRPVPKRM